MEAVRLGAGGTRKKNNDQKYPSHATSYCAIPSIRLMVEIDDIWTTARGLGSYSSKSYITHSPTNHTALEPIEVVPSNFYGRPNFINRDNLSLNEIQQQLNRNYRVVIYGMPGVGKTEIAAQLVRHGREKHKY